MSNYIRFAPWHNNIFGETLFGIPPEINTSVGFNIVPENFNSLLINWNPAPGNWNEQVLVRSSTGIPNRIYDGTVLLDQTDAPFSVAYLDQELSSGLFYYYSLFVFNTTLNEYVIVGAGQGLVLTDWGFCQQFAQWLPEWYIDLDNDQATQAQPEGPLQRFLCLIGYEMDWMRSEIETMFTLTNTRQVSGALLPYVSANLGIDYEPELSMTRSRVLVTNAVNLYKTRGTTPGIEAAASAFSGFGCKITTGINQEIQLDDSAFDRSVGHWKHLSNCTIDQVPAISVNITPVHTAYNPANNTNILQIISTGGVISFSTCNEEDAIVLGIPADVNATPQNEVLSGYFHPNPQATPADSISWIAQIDWYGPNGAYISSSPGTPVADVQGDWIRAFTAATAPANATTFGRTFTSESTVASDVIAFFDAEQVEINTQSIPGPTAWDPPRDIKINLLPIRQNLVPDPQGLGGGFNWSATGGTITPSMSILIPWPADTTGGYILQETAGSTLQAVIGPMPVISGDFYSWSNYLMAATISRSVTVGVAFYTAGNVWIDSYSSPAFDDLTSGFSRFEFDNLEAPTNAAKAYGIITIAGVGSGEEHYLGAPLFEPLAYVQPYFDANFSPVSDYIFEGTPNQSISDYYPLLQTKLGRLLEVMPDYVPIGATFSLLYGAEALSNVYE